MNVDDLLRRIDETGIRLFGEPQVRECFYCSETRDCWPVENDEGGVAQWACRDCYAEVCE